jgi:hypothetical protein
MTNRLRNEGTTTMRRHGLFDSLTTLESLELKLSPTSLLAGTALPAPAVSHLESGMSPDDPQPDPEPSPGPYPGDNPPVEYPEFPPSGPVGPGLVGY